MVSLRRFSSRHHCLRQLHCIQSGLNTCLASLCWEAPLKGTSDARESASAGSDTSLASACLVYRTQGPLRRWLLSFDAGEREKTTTELDTRMEGPLWLSVSVSPPPPHQELAVSPGAAARRAMHGMLWAATDAKNEIKKIIKSLDSKGRGIKNPLGKNEPQSKRAGRYLPSTHAALPHAAGFNYWYFFLS